MQQEINTVDPLNRICTVQETHEARDKGTANSWLNHVSKYSNTKYDA